MQGDLGRGTAMVSREEAGTFVKDSSGLWCLLGGFR